jgi:hypothetical protein
MAARKSAHTTGSAVVRFQSILILIAASIFVALILIIGYLRIGPHVQHYFSNIPFDSETWKRAKESSDPVRIFMVDNLLATYHLIGMSRADIDNPLGTPPETPFFAKYDYIYWLGPERSFLPIDSEWLGIRFEEDRVVEVKLLND